MPEVRAQHPLDDDYDEDDDDIEFGAARAPERALVHQPLLKIGTRGIIVSFIVLFISAVVTAAAPPSSTMESVGSSLNYWSGAALLVGCSAILVAYRIPHLKTTALHLGRRSRGSPGFQTLVGVNLVGFFFATVVLALLLSVPTFRPAIFILFLGLLPVLSGLLLTMAIWHSGYLRAYAVGVLTVMGMLLHSGYSFYMLSFSSGLPPYYVGMLQLVVPLGLALLTGTACAGYVHVLSAYRDKKLSMHSSGAHDSARTDPSSLEAE